MATAKREAISKRVRFEVFKRDNFKCQYCGKSAPEIILHVDHISPVSKGGKADILNLITSCVDCNAGKSDVPLSDSSALQKQRAQLEELNERREQLEMMLEWREGLEGINEQALDAVTKAWREAAPGFSLNETGLREARKRLKEYGLNAFLDAIGVARDNYIKIQDGKASQESVEIAWKKIGGIVRLSQQPEWRRQLYYIRGILRNRCSYVNEWECMRALEAAVAAGIELDWLKHCALQCWSWNQFMQWVEDAISEATKDAK